MDSFELVLPIGSVELGLALLALGLLFGAWLSRRARVEPLGYWPFAWAALTGVGALRVAGAPQAYEYAGSAFYCAFLVAGAYRYADRPIPVRLFPVTLGIAIAAILLYFVGAQAFVGGAAVVLAPLSTCYAAKVVHDAVHRRKASLLHRLVPLGLVALAILGVYDHVTIGQSLDSFSLWLVAGVPIATNQAIAVFDRIRSRADSIATELEKSVSLLQATLESTADGILVVDVEGNYTSYNQLFRTMWGIPDEVVGTKESEIVLQFAKRQLKDPEGFYQTVMSLYAHPERESFDTLEFEDGRCFERYSRPQRVGRKVVGRVWSFRDVTSRKRAEETIRRDKDHLEDVILERTRELIESRDHLRQADRMAAIGTLAAGVAHQINNPIGAILNSAEFALLCSEDENSAEHFESALKINVEEAKRCGAIVRGMLQFARDEPVDKIVEDLNQVVRRAFKAVDSYSRDRTAIIELELCDEPILLRMSSLEMEQVVVNLFRNAIESRPSGVVVCVRTYFVRSGFVRNGLARSGFDGGGFETDGFAESSGARADRKTDWAILEISDNGGGIDEKDRARIFDPFFSTRLMEGGTGLGLSVAHGIVMDHAGKIAVAGSAGNGTTITVELPIDESDGDQGDQGD